MAFLLMLLLVIASVSETYSSEIDTRSPLDQPWEAYMLAGLSSFIADGKRLGEGGSEHFLYKGHVDAVWPSRRGIRIEDLRETSFGGLLTLGGWRLQGGLVSEIRAPRGAVELYGKSRWQVQPQLFHFGLSPPWFARHSYDFFLLFRPPAPNGVHVIKRWHIDSNRLPYDYNLRGQLEDNDDSVRVFVTGLTDDKVFLVEILGKTDIPAGTQ